LRGFQQRLAASLRSRAAAARARLVSLAQRRAFRRPYDLVRERARRVDELEIRAARAVRNLQTRAADRLAALAGRLESLSPLAVLGRGYSLTQRAADGSLVRSTAEISVGEQILTRLESGRLISRIEQIEE
jgi:exodeoxyribonuclease VII large subunit